MKHFKYLAIALALLSAPADAANRFWVGGAGTWDTSATTHWSSSTGGAGGASVPGASDIAICDGSSGGGTITAASSITSISGFTTSACVNTVDFSANNPSFTIGASGWTDANTGAHIVNMGSGTWTFNLLTGSAINFSTGLNFTLNANTSTVLLAPSTTATATRSITLNGQSLNTVTISGTNQAGFQVSLSAGSGTIATLNLTNGAMLSASNGSTFNITNAFNVTGTASALVFIQGTGGGVAAILKANGGATLAGVAFAHVSFAGSSGAVNPTNSFDFGGNNFNGGSLTSPTFGGGGGGIQGIISAAP